MDGESEVRQLILFTLLSLTPIAAGNAEALFDAGTSAYGRGDLSAAAELWHRSTDPRAPFMLGNMAKKGKLKDCDPIYCAAKLFQQSGEAGYLPALVELAALNINNGYMEEGVNILQIGARWNDPDCRRILEEMGRAVPPPDLYEQHTAEQAQAQLRERSQQQVALDAKARQDRTQAQQDWVDKFMYGMALGAMMTPRRTPSRMPPPPSYRCETQFFGSSSVSTGTSNCRPY